MDDVQDARQSSRRIAERGNVYGYVNPVGAVAVPDDALARLALRAAFSNRGRFPDEQLAREARQVQRAQFLPDAFALGTVPKLRRGTIPQHYVSVERRGHDGLLQRLQHVAVELVDAGAFLRTLPGVVVEALLLEEAHQAFVRDADVAVAVVSVDAARGIDGLEDPRGERDQL